MNSPHADVRDRAKAILEIAEPLSQEMLECAARVQDLWPDVSALIRKSVDVAGSERSRGLYSSLEEKHLGLATRTAGLIGRAGRLVRGVVAENYDAEIQRVRDHIRTVDAQNLASFADHALIGRLTDARERAALAPFRAPCHAAVALVAVAPLVFLHERALVAFLGRPPGTRIWAEKAKTILLSVATEFVPGSSTGWTVLQELEPRIERELRNVPNDVAYLERLFSFDDILGAAHEACRSAADSVSSAEEGLDVLVSQFRLDVATLLQVPTGK